MDSKVRCTWCVGEALYERYHDEEWGVPVYDDATFFEFLILETFQAGLSWITILRRRETFRIAFDQFDYQKIAKYDEAKIQLLLQDPGIIRHQLKVRSAVSNAIAFMQVQEEFGSFSNYIWKFTNGEPLVNLPNEFKELASTTSLSDAISKDLKKRGFKFVGSTIVYAFLQATGLINDHLSDCWKAPQ